MGLRGVRIKGIGSSLPRTRISNAELSKIVDTTDEWIRSRTGIRERRYVSKGQTLVSLLVAAANEALERAHVSALELDLIVSATTIPDNLYPSAACEVQRELKADNACAFNVSAACSGFVYVMKVASAFIQSGMYKKVLILGGDLHSHVMDWEDRATCILFGDGAGAMVLSETELEDNEMLGVNLYSDGSKGFHLTLPNAGRLSPLVSNQERTKPLLKMNGREIYKFSVSIIPEAVHKSIEGLGLKLEDIDYLVPHQANIRIVKALSEKLGFKEDKLIANLQYYGNTSSASIPIALNGAIKEGRIKTPSTIALVGFGGGLTWGVGLVRWNLGKL